MSLDVYLHLPPSTRTEPVEKIYVREDGRTREVSREEWQQRFPGAELVTVVVEPLDEVFECNITHNLGPMAYEAGLYKWLWRPEEVGATHTRQLIEPLRKGLDLLQSDPERFQKFNPANGWGDYHGLVKFVSKYLEVCEKYPDAEITVSR